MANKQLALLEGQTVTLQCKSTYEGKNAIDKTMTLTDQVDFKELVEPMGGELNGDGVHVDLFLKGLAVGNGTIALPFGYDGKTEGTEGVDISTVNIDVNITKPEVFLTSPTPSFDYDVGGTFELPIAINNGTEDIVLNDPGIAFMDSQAMLDIITVGPDRLMVKPNAGWVPDPGSITGELTLYYYSASVKVPYTFVVPEPRKLTAVVEGGVVSPFATGEKTLTITDQHGAPVTDATLVSVNISTERNATGVYEYLAQYLMAKDAPNGVYAFDYAGLYTGAKVTLAFKVSSGGVEYDLNPVDVKFGQQAFTVSINPTIIPKGATTASVDVTINLKRSKNGTALPCTGTLAQTATSGATMTTTPALGVSYRIRTFKLTNIPTSGTMAYIGQMLFTSTEHNSEPYSVLIQIPRAQ